MNFSNNQDDILHRYSGVGADDVFCLGQLIINF